MGRWRGRRRRGPAPSPPRSQGRSAAEGRRVGRMETRMSAEVTTRSAQLGVIRGAALYVGALLGPGLLLVPALGVQAAGPASIIAWAGLLVLSAPLAITFAALGVRYPVSGGVSAYVRAGFGDAAAAVTGGWFVAAVIIGAPAVAIIGGYYVADLTGGGPPHAPRAGGPPFPPLRFPQPPRPPPVSPLPPRPLSGALPAGGCAHRGAPAGQRGGQPEP